MDLMPAWERRRFTAQEVLRMVEAGILGTDEPLELLDGELVVTPPETDARLRVGEMLLP